tara:strand:+ start:165 stop:479 length:315 start_codon:yes stop_codon:yes gene_type:complete
MKYDPSINRALIAFRSEQANQIETWGVRPAIETVPDKDIALALSWYIFCQSGMAEDYTAQSAVFGGYNRVHMHEGGFEAIKSHCMKDFLANLATHCPWVKVRDF